MNGVKFGLACVETRDVTYVQQKLPQPWVLDSTLFPGYPMQDVPRVGSPCRICIVLVGCSSSDWAV